MVTTATSHTSAEAAAKPAAPSCHLDRNAPSSRSVDASELIAIRPSGRVPLATASNRLTPETRLWFRSHGGRGESRYALVRARRARRTSSLRAWSWRQPRASVRSAHSRKPMTDHNRSAAVSMVRWGAR